MTVCMPFRVAAGMSIQARMVTVGSSVFARLSSMSITIALVSFVSLWRTVTAPLPRRACEARVHADGVDNNRCILSYKTLEELWLSYNSIASLNNLSGLSK